MIFHCLLNIVFFNIRTENQKPSAQYSMSSSHLSNSKKIQLLSSPSIHQSDLMRQRNSLIKLNTVVSTKLKHVKIHQNQARLMLRLLDSGLVIFISGKWKYLMKTTKLVNPSRIPTKPSNEVRFLFIYSDHQCSKIGKIHSFRI